MNVRSIKYLLKFITYNYEYLKVKKINFSELEALDIKLDYTSKQTLKTTVNKYLKLLKMMFFLMF